MIDVKDLVEVTLNQQDDFLKVEMAHKQQIEML